LDVRRIGWAVLRSVAMTLLYALFFVLLFLRGIVKGLARLYVGAMVLFFVVAYFLKPNIPTAAYVWNGVFVFLAAFISYKYDSLLQWLEPEGRTLVFDA
jgi:hypothetical protein